jgi:hypothetical protein
MAERHHGRRLRALLESLPFKLGKEVPERLAIAPDNVQAQSGDLHGSPVFGSAALHGLIFEALDRGSKLIRRFTPERLRRQKGG